MNFCAGCGSPNLDTDATCRVCGRSLHGTQPPGSTAATEQPDTDGEVVTTVPTAATAAPTVYPPTEVTTGGSDRAIHPAATASDRPAAPTGLQPTGVAGPMGFESAPPPVGAGSRSGDAMPSFMRSEGRAVEASSSPETTSLISEHDLPEWIRQIGADDAKKLAAQQEEERAAARASGTTLPSHLGRGALPGQTLTDGRPASSWLNRKDTVAGAAGAAWDVTGASPPARSLVRVDAAPAPQQAAAPADQAPINLDSATGVGAVSDPAIAGSENPREKRRRRGITRRENSAAPMASPVDSTGGPRAGGSMRVFLLAAVVLVLVLALAMQLL